MKLYFYLRSINSFKLFLWLALIATVASVPTSVLVQNSELASNAQQNHADSNKNHNNNNVMTKVKRSSGGNKNDGHLNNNSPAAILNKKSSPEIVPASYTAPPKPKSIMPQLQQQQQQRQEGNELNFNNNAMEKNNDLISSAIAAGLTAAAVEAAAVAANQHELEQLRKQHQLYADDIDDEQTSSAINKRGISAQQFPYRSASSSASAANLGWGNMAGVNNDFNSGIYNSPSAGYYNPYGSFDSLPAVGNDVPQGTWGDELDPGNVVYSDIDDYAPVSKTSSYRNKAYDNLQNILNSESYLDTVPLPYNSGRYYSSGLDTERNKRAYKIFNQLASKFPDMRLKRDTKLTPADMLALVALVEAGERARKDTDADAGYTYPSENYVPKTYGLNNNYNTAGNVYDYPTMPQADESLDYNNNNGWFEPQSMVDYYGMPVNMDAMNKYELPRELPRENKYSDGFPLNTNGNRYNNKRFMVAKKKRSIAKPSIPYKPESFF
ncbi:uncharacterized protein LOC111681402 isoform X1 [Lucilia cuprina]|uniref:uncharacterized protein LOC111681402 isoform X1 n=2 Tax=Lucilia cuprina TaxID=7375 RepID=UPI001F0548F1|nr:uncharacterized protein LOC111681402 isoform X1 [Lucilia cuprina]